MIDEKKKLDKQDLKERVRKRIRITVDADNYEYYPEKKQADYYDNETAQRVAVYVRVSTDDVRQTTSFELQKRYYEDFVTRHPNWTLVGIYADEGISGTSLAHRVRFSEMISDCKDGKIDMIVTKSVSRFARNVVDCIGIVRNLAELKTPVGVFFESECIFSLNEDSQMALSFQATMAEEESHTRSRSMEASLRMRLDNGIPLTPELLGYRHDADGQLVINPEEAPTVKLVFSMYLVGYSSTEIANKLNELRRKSYLGNVNWTSGGVVQMLRNERHCGDVLTRKSFTPNYRDHKSKKNCGQRPQSKYLNHHEAIISRDDFNAVQRMLDNAKYGNKSMLPELRVVDSGILKGFVVINPRWAAFKESDYIMAANSVYKDESASSNVTKDPESTFSANEGDFDLRGFEVIRSEFLSTINQPAVSFADRKIKFGAECVKKFGARNRIELMVNPIEGKFAIRPTDSQNRQSVLLSTVSNGKYVPRDIAASAFFDTLYDLFHWNKECKYKITGTLIERDGELAYIFDTANSEAYIKSFMLPLSKNEDESFQPLTPSGKRIRAVPECWTTSFGTQFHLHQQKQDDLRQKAKLELKLQQEGRLFETGQHNNVTSLEELKRYIANELSQRVKVEEAINV